MRTPISAALIVRDEKYHIAGCLRVIAGIVDEMLIVDTEPAAALGRSQLVTGLA